VLLIRRFSPSPFSHGCSDEAFLQVYPEADKSFAALCTKIRKARKEHGHSSRRGTPLEREGSNERHE